MDLHQLWLLPKNVLNITFVNINLPTLSYESYVVAMLTEHVPLASCSMKTGIMSLAFNVLPTEPGKQHGALNKHVIYTNIHTPKCS